MIHGVEIANMKMEGWRERKKKVGDIGDFGHWLRSLTRENGNGEERKKMAKRRRLVAKIIGGKERERVMY